MAKIRNISGQDLDVPGVGVIEDEAILELPDALSYGYTCQESNWEPIDAAAQTEFEEHDEPAPEVDDEPESVEDDD